MGAILGKFLPKAASEIPPMAISHNILLETIGLASPDPA